MKFHSSPTTSPTTSMVEEGRGEQQQKDRICYRAEDDEDDDEDDEEDEEDDKIRDNNSLC